MSRLSIVIPAFSNAELLEQTLVSVLENQPDSTEIIVVNRFGYEDPYELGEEVRFVQAPARSSLVDCLILGMEHATSDVVHFLESGTSVTCNWTEKAITHFDDPRIGLVSTKILDSESEKILSAGLNYKSGGKIEIRGHRSKRPDDFDYIDDILAGSYHGVFVRKSAYDAVEGYCRRLPAVIADVDLGLRLEAAGYEAVFEPSSIVHFHEKIGPNSNSRWKAISNGFALEKLFWRNTPVRGWTKSLFLHFFAVTSNFFGMLREGYAVSHLVGRTFGLVCSITSIGNRSFIKKLKEEPQPELPQEEFSGTVSYAQARKDAKQEALAGPKFSEDIQKKDSVKWNKVA